MAKIWMEKNEKAKAIANIQEKTRALMRKVLVIAQLKETKMKVNKKNEP